MAESTLETISRELQLIRRAIRRSRLHSTGLALALIISVVVGVAAKMDSARDDRREHNNLVFVLEARCEAHNRERRQDAEVLIGAATNSESSPEAQATIKAYRELLRKTETDCSAEVASLLP